MEPLTDLIITISNPDKKIDYKRKQICFHTMRAISHANRVSLWSFDSSISRIDCLMCLNDETNEYSSGTHLLESDFKEYFEAILAQEVLVASDARTHPSTSCFNEAYFIPNKIYSLLDYVLIKDGRPFGIICCERVGQRQEWLDSDISMLRRIANMTAMFF